jgi:hypothetical protein
MAIEWLAEHVRVSLFSNAAVQIVEDDWRAVTKKKEADARQAIPGGHLFGGVIEPGLLNFSAAYNRIDMILGSPPLTELPAEPQFISVGRWEQARDTILALAHSWIEKNKFPVVRLAFGAVLVCPASDRKNAYETLKGLIPTVKVDADRMHELSYRVNWPTTSEARPKLIINRITNWSVIAVAYTNVQVPGSPVGPTSIPQLHGVRLEIDNNTDIKHAEPFTPIQQVAILDEAHASNTAMKGTHLGSYELQTAATGVAPLSAWEKFSLNVEQR